MWCETMALGGQIIDRKSFTIIIEKNNVHTDLRILFLKFWDIFQMNGKRNSVKI